MSDSLNISKKTFLSALIILFVLLIGAGLLTQIIPMGTYEYITIDGKETIVADSFKFIEGDKLPVYHWFIAPVSVLFTDEGLIIIVITLFLLIVGGSIHVLNEVKVLKAIIESIVDRFKDKKYMLIALITAVFMALGAFIGIFEEVIPLIPLIIGLSIALGFDEMTGLGMSLLAAGFGFAAAVTNPFTIGVAQTISGVAVFSGAFYRLIIFTITYIVLTTLLIRYAKGIEKESKEIVDREEVKNRGAVKWFVSCTVVMIILIIVSPAVPILSSYNLPIIGLVFLLSGLGSGLISSLSIRKTLSLFLDGTKAMGPGVALILLASGVKHVIQSGQIMDTILYYTANSISGKSQFTALLLVYLLVFLMNFFIGSGSAKAFIVMPIIAPLMDMLGISRQMAVLAFQFGDGFSNILYPTNAVLLIGIGLANVSYGKWLKWVLKYQIIMGIMSIVFLYVGLRMGY